MSSRPSASAFLASLSRFNRSFWAANSSELFERIAFYGMSPVLVPYLTQVRGIEESAAIRLNGNFGLVVWGITVLSGFLADLMGYRRAMMMAYGFLAAGYLLVGQLADYWGIAAALLLVAFGASLIKPTITGTVQNTCSPALRPLGFSIYYMLVNIGGFLGPNLSGPVVDARGKASAFVVSAVAVLVALAVVAFLFREPDREAPAEPRTPAKFARDFARVLTNPRMLLLFVFVAGFWGMYWQLYNTMPLYLLEDLGLSQKATNFLISLGALAIVCFQVLVGYLTRGIETSRAIFLGVLIAASGFAVMGLRPSMAFVAAGVLILAVGEMIYSAHFYAYVGTLAPPGQVGMYMGFAFLPIALGSFLAGQIGGPVSAWSRTAAGRPASMFFVFAGVGLVAALGLYLLSRLARQEEAS